MTDNEKQHGRFAPTETDLAFFGRITASVTHELNNVISIIEQTAGLLDDLIAGEERGIPITTERLTALSASIQKQTRRGLGIIDSLNRFAHTTDATETKFDINDVVSNLIELSHRLASLRKIRLAYQPTPSPQYLIGNPFAIQHAVFESLLIALTCGPTDSAVSVETLADDDSVRIFIPFEGAGPLDADRTTNLKNMLALTGGSLKVETTASATRLTLRLPRKRNP